jgi:hypothetical protein
VRLIVYKATICDAVGIPWLLRARFSSKQSQKFTAPLVGFYSWPVSRAGYDLRRGKRFLFSVGVTSPREPGRPIWFRTNEALLRTEMEPRFASSRDHHSVRRKDCGPEGTTLDNLEGDRILRRNCHKKLQARFTLGVSERLVLPFSGWAGWTARVSGECVPPDFA